jgi:ribosomal-protein-alanine N-acetyltransferase
MTAGDLDAVTALAAEAAGAPLWTRQIYESAIGGEHSAALVAIDNGAVDNRMLIGFAIAISVLDICQLESIVVAETSRRQGIGASLLTAVVAWSCARNSRRIELEVRAGNSGAIALYQQAGFIRDGRRRGYYRNPGEDAVLMSLALGLPSETVEKNP